MSEVRWMRSAGRNRPFTAREQQVQRPWGRAEAGLEERLAGVRGHRSRQGLALRQRKWKILDV